MTIKTQFPLPPTTKKFQYVTAKCQENKFQKLENVVRKTVETGETGDTRERGDTRLTGPTVLRPDFKNG